MPGPRSEAHPGLLDRWSDPTVVLVAAGALAVASLIPWAVKAPFTLPLALFLPGHALLAALDRPDRTLTAGPRVALRVALSMAIVSLVVLAVGWALGVDRFTVIGSVWLFTSLAALAAWNRDLPSTEASAGPRFTQSGVLLALTGAIAVVVVVGALVFLPRPRDPAYSQISFTGTTRTSGSPIVVRSGRTAEVKVAVVNGTSKTITYRVIPAIDGGAVWRAPKVRLGPGDRWSGTVKGVIPKEACLSRLTVSLAANAETSGVSPLVTYVRNEAGDACG